MKNKFKNYLKRILELISRPEMKILPGQLAYFIILAIFPLLTLFGYITTKVLKVALPLAGILDKFIPSDIINVIKPFIENNAITSNVTLSMIIGFILVSNGTHSIITTANELYGIKKSDYLKDRIKAIFMIIILMFLFVFIIVVLAYGNIIVKKIIELDFLSHVSDKIYVLFVLLKWPVAFVLIFWILKILYTLAPDTKISSKFMNKGALFTTLCWIVTTSVYSYYVSNIANYTLFYGSISSIIVMMIWIYILSYIFVMGIAINADEYNIFIMRDNK